MNPHTRIPILALAAACCLAAGAAAAKDIHVAKSGNDQAPGTAAAPLLTISAAAASAMPGDTITVHAGVYREHVNPPRGGTSDQARIIYQAAPGEKVTLTGSEPATGWQKVGNDTWKLRLPNAYFGKFNPYAEVVHGDWYDPQGRIHHRGGVYLNGQPLTEAPSLEAVNQAPGAKPLWFATVDGAPAVSDGYLLNVLWLQPAGGAKTAAPKAAARHGTQNAPASENGECVGFIRKGNWLRFDQIDFGKGAETLDIRAAAAAGAGGSIDLRLDQADGESIGMLDIPVTGDWQRWESFTAKIKKTSGTKTLYLVFNPAAPVAADQDHTVIYAQFPATDPNQAPVEINVRATVFTPLKTNIDYITVRGFDLRNAATNWAAPTAGQVGLVTAYWCKGWIIENNEISHSRCCGVALGKYSDQWDGKRGNTEGYYLTIDDALKKDGWTKEKIGGHIVRNNHIHHCGQTGVVGSLGCAFSQVVGNEIHDINLHGMWAGAEMGGIKFHGALDTIIADNHIYRCGNLAGIWLDWMAQGTQVTGNLLHDNHSFGGDLFCEVNHGPYLVANNLLLSNQNHLSNSRGGAYVHNLIAGLFQVVPDGRRTPYFKAHGTELVAMHDCPAGDARLFNNLFARNANISAYNNATLPVAAGGNVYTKGTQGTKHDTASLTKPDFDAGLKLTQKPDGWYLELNVDSQWATEQPRKVVTAAMLGKAIIPNLPFENPDGSPMNLATDYFGKPRNASATFPGPFDNLKNGKNEIKVWPK